MKTYKLYANVNPIEPNCQFPIASSSELCMAPERAKEYLIEKGQELKAKGYKVSLDIISIETIKI